MKKVILMAAASLAIFATSFAQNTATTPAEAPKMGKKSRVKPVGDAPAMQGTPTPATQTQGTPAGESRKGRGEGEARSEGKGRGTRHSHSGTIHPHRPQTRLGDRVKACRVI